MAFSENLKKLPGISHLAAIELRDGEGNLAGIIENKAGSQGSLAVYNHLGFEQIGVRKNYYPSTGSTREDAIVMRLMLNEHDHES